MAVGMGGQEGSGVSGDGGMGVQEGSGVSGDGGGWGGVDGGWGRGKGGRKFVYLNIL